MESQKEVKGQYISNFILPIALICVTLQLSKPMGGKAKIAIKTLKIKY